MNSKNDDFGTNLILILKKSYEKLESEEHLRKTAQVHVLLGELEMVVEHLVLVLLAKHNKSNVVQHTFQSDQTCHPGEELKQNLILKHSLYGHISFSSLG